MNVFSKDYTSVSDWNTDGGGHGGMVRTPLSSLYQNVVSIHKRAEAEKDERNRGREGEERIKLSENMNGKALPGEGRKNPVTKGSQELTGQNRW
jgi:hypothetical protein